MKRLLLFILCLPFLCGWSNDRGWDNPNTQVIGTELSVYTYSNNLTNDGSFNLPASTDGLGLVKATSQDTLFTVDKDGTVIISGNSTLVNATDKDNYLCVFDGGDGYATIKNRLGATKKVKVIYYFQKE